MEMLHGNMDYLEPTAQRHFDRLMKSVHKNYIQEILDFISWKKYHTLGHRQIYLFSVNVMYMVFVSISFSQNLKAENYAHLKYLHKTISLTKNFPLLLPSSTNHGSYRLQIAFDLVNLWHLQAWPTTNCTPKFFFTIHLGKVPRSLFQKSIKIHLGEIYLISINPKWPPNGNFVPIITP